MSPEAIIAKLSEAVPRYTSYPTAPHFHTGIGPATTATWLRAVEAGSDISLYVHIPYCDRLCWFCACHTRMTHRYEPIVEYLDALRNEIDMVGELLDGRGRVSAVHFGGGSPTMLKPDDLIGLDRMLRETFPYRDDVAFSVEIEPNDMNDEKLDTLARIGVNRASLGVQDFDPKVQAAINREQSFALTQSVVTGLRARRIHSVNLDLLYGLPHQTVASVVATVEQAVSLRPDRIALFGYAHVPWFKKHQTMIDEAVLPNPLQRLDQAQAAADTIRRAGYHAVGIDHFALPGDALSNAAQAGRLHRNFQGYTDDDCQTLIGLGASSISRFRQGYAQNTVATGAYSSQCMEGRLPIARGIALSADDIARAWVIERLMCDFDFSPEEAVRKFGRAAHPIIAQATQLSADSRSGLQKTADGRFAVHPGQRLFVRTIAAEFDAYLKGGTAKHSIAV